MMKELTSENQFEAEVLQSNETVIVDFWAPWCGPCKSLAPLLDELSKESKIKIVKVNVDELPELTQQWNIQAIPTLVYFAKGKPVDRTTGTQTKKAILQKVSSLGK